MVKKFAAAILLGLFIFPAVQAGKLHCRSGMVLAAELTRVDLKVANLSQHGFPEFPAERIYAVVTIKLDEIRNISIFDYKLNLNGVDYSCVALWRGNRFEYTVDTVKSPAVQQLLFIVDNKVVTSSDQLTITLKSCLTDARDMYDLPVPFTVIGNKAPTAPGKVPAAGSLKVKLIK